ncbi:MAG: nucleotidyl transferase AbiEii/AbiGii toxin family protein [Alphaproteobacteria bacterium]|nr:nucleotidyl transferase AbiEii/AbiGii toxin family protein [Alphaproteobacteria bacterium]
MNLYDAPDVERRAVFVEAAAKIGIRQDMIEKDFWVSWVLNRMFNDDELARIFLFKGGTSLSKAFNCIRRFSEDIDLLLALSEVSDPGESFLKERSRNAINTFKSKTGKRTAAYVKEILKPRLSALLAPYCIVIQDPSEPNNLYVKFSSVFSSSGYIRSDIKLEIGAFAEGTPFAPMKIQSYVSEQFEEFTEDCVRIPTVSIARTFWEKITVLHYLNFLPSEKATPMRLSRHYYDIFMLANSEYREMIYSAASLLNDIVAFDRKFYQKPGVDYDKMGLRTLRLSPPPQRAADLERDYSQMQEMIFGEKPTWQVLLQFLAILEKKLYSL